MPRILFYGSSTTEGYCARDGEGLPYPEQVKYCFMDQHTTGDLERGILVRNLGEGGETSSRTVYKLSHDTGLYLPSQGRTIVSVMLGGYDHAIRKNESEPVTSRFQFGRDMFEISRICASTGAIALFMTSPFFDDSRSQPVKVTGETFNVEDRRAYSNDIRNHVRRHNHYFLDIFAEMEESGIDVKDYMSFDNVHTNAKGHAYIGERVIQMCEHILHVTNPKPIINV